MNDKIDKLKELIEKVTISFSLVELEYLPNQIFLIFEVLLDYLVKS